MLTRGQHRSAAMARREGPAGVKERSRYALGSPGTWEIPPSPVHGSGWAAGETAWLASVALHARGSEQASAAQVPPSEGNEARRDGRREVAAPHRTDEAGEPTQGTRRREGGAGERNRWRER